MTTGSATCRELDRHCPGLYRLLSHGGAQVQRHRGSRGKDNLEFYGRCEVSDWTDIISSGCGYYYTVGLKAGGTVVAVGGKMTSASVMWTPGRISSTALRAAITRLGLRATTPWSPWEITGVGSAMSATGRISPRLLRATGIRWGLVPTTAWSLWDGYDDGSGRCRRLGNITQVAAGEKHTVGLKADGTVVAVGAGKLGPGGQCNVGGWTNIIVDRRGQIAYSRA